MADKKYDFGGICYKEESVSYSTPGNIVVDGDQYVYYRWFYDTANPTDIKYLKTGEAHSSMFSVRHNAVLDKNAH